MGFRKEREKRVTRVYGERLKEMKKKGLWNGERESTNCREREEIERRRKVKLSCSEFI